MGGFVYVYEASNNNIGVYEVKCQTQLVKKIVPCKYSSEKLISGEIAFERK